MSETISKMLSRLDRDSRATLIRKALDSATNVGEALVPEKLEQIITNTVVRLAPEIAVIKPEHDAQKSHEFNRLTTLPAAGGAMGEGATTPTRNAAYQRANVELKVVRRKGAVTNFLSDAAANYIDAAEAEMENHLQAHVYDLITYILYGNAEANQYAHSGIDFFAQTNRINETWGGTVPSSLSFLDEMIDRNHELQGQGHDKVFVMSPRMLSLVSRLLTNVRLNQGLIGEMTVVEINGGWRLNAYRDIPIIESGATRPKGQMTAISVASAGAGGAISDDTYYFQVAPVTWNGEQIASAEGNVATTGADTITVSWTAYPGALFYKVYSGLTSGEAKLIRVIAAHTYDGDGTITGDTTSIVFSADPAADSSVPTALQADNPLNYTGGVPPEYVMLWDLDRIQGLGKYAYTNRGGARFNGMVTLEDLARTDDFLPFLIKTYGALVPSFEATTVVHRGLRVA